MSYDTRKFARVATVAVMSALLIGALTFGSIPTIVEDDGSTSVEVQEGYATQEADGAVLTGSAVAAGLLITGGVTGYYLKDKDISMDDTDTTITENTYTMLDQLRVRENRVDNFAENFENYGTAPQMSAAKRKMVELYNNGTALSTMKIEGKEEFRDAVSEVQANIVAQHNAAMYPIAEAQRTYNTTGNYQRLTVGGSLAEEPQYGDVSKNNATVVQGHETVTLANGTSMNVSSVQLAEDDGAVLSFQDSGNNYPNPDALVEHSAVDLDGDGTNELEQRTMYNASKLYYEFERLNDKSDTLSNDIETIADGIANNYERGEIDTANVTSPFERAAYYASEWESTGSDKYAKAFLESIGEDRGNASFEIQLEDGTVLDGGLYGDALSTVEAGNEYYYAPDLGSTDYANMSINGSEVWNATETVSFVTTEGKSWSLEQNFTVESLKNPETGEALNSTSFEKLTWEDTNVTSLKEELQQLERLQERYEDIKSGSGGIPGGSQTMLIIGGLAVAGYLISRGNEGDGNGGNGGGTTVVGLGGADK